MHRSVVVHRRSRLEPDIRLVVLKRVSDAPALGVAVRSYVVRTAKISGLVGPVVVVVASDPRLIPRDVVATIHAWVAVNFCGSVCTQPAEWRRGRWWRSRSSSCDECKPRGEHSRQSISFVRYLRGEGRELVVSSLEGARVRALAATGDQSDRLELIWPRVHRIWPRRVHCPSSPSFIFAC